jgi:3-methyl-2-oxobutanoate hydroxymethyltransferase
MSMRNTLTTLNNMKQSGDKITMLTCYDASFAAVLDAAGVDTLLIGDSLGMVLQGHDSTLRVTLRDVEYHTGCVARGAQRALIIADMPFGSFQVTPQKAFTNAARLMAAGAQMVKIEGGETMVPTIEFLSARGVACVRSSRPDAPVCPYAGRVPRAGQDADACAGVDQRSENARSFRSRNAGTRVDPAVLAREVTAALRISDYRDWRRRRLHRAGTRPARYARHLSRQESKVRQEFHAWNGKRARRDRGLCERGQSEEFSRGRTFVLMYAMRAGSDFLKGQCRRILMAGAAWD